VRGSLSRRVALWTTAAVLLSTVVSIAGQISPDSVPGNSVDVAFAVVTPTKTPDPFIELGIGKTNDTTFDSRTQQARLFLFDVQNPGDDHPGNKARGRLEILARKADDHGNLKIFTTKDLQCQAGTRSRLKLIVIKNGSASIARVKCVAR
jgi:hypothetical protein